MLEITVGADEWYDENTKKFVYPGGTKLQLEHSLVSLSKWEAQFEKNFLGNNSLTPEELLAYIHAMVLTENVSGETLKELSAENYAEINAYLDRKHSATWFHEAPGGLKTRTETITSELVYYWMTVYNIPFTCETWPLSRLFALIKIASIKAEKPKKMSKAEIAARNRALNEQRKQQLGTNG